MKTLHALTCSFVALTFSAIAHAAPVQYQLTALHESEYSILTSSIRTQLNPLATPVNPSNYFFAEGTPITATFYYDSAVAAAHTNVPVTLNGSSGTYTALSSRYSAFSNLTLEIAEYSIEAAGYFVQVGSFPLYAPNTFVIDSDNTSDMSRDSIQGAFFSSNFNHLAFGDYKATGASIIIGGHNDMLSDQSLPNTLTELNSSVKGIIITFQNSSTTHNAFFSNGTISQVPLPSAAIFFLSGLIGLGANAARKLKR